MIDLDKFRELREDLQLFGRTCLKVRTKGGEITPFILNRTQTFIHNKLEEQRTKYGWVRALILKARQQGASTYVAARYYHRSSLRRGTNVYILAHEQPASDTLFGIVDRYHRNNPLAPSVGKSNIKELEFDKLDSSYAVATAGAKAGGRSKSLSLFHGSEVAFWPNPKDHFAASVQGVPLLSGTEVILESTSAGGSGEFFQRYQEAEGGLGNYIALFTPWFWDDGYRLPVPPDFELRSEAEEGAMSEVEYAAIYSLDMEQMVWRRDKIDELRSPLLFNREYPACAADAWTANPDHMPYIDPLSVLRARKRTTQASGPLIIGVDPASGGGDRFAVAARRGMRVVWIKSRDRIEHGEAVLWLRDIIEQHKPERVNIDAGNIGAAVVSSLRSIGPKYVDLIRGVNFGSTSQAKTARPKVPGPVNRRAEMWMRLRDWLLMEEGAAIPDDDALQSDMLGPKIKPKLNNDFLLEAKADMKKRGLRSPDLADAVALTFASMEFFANYSEPVRESLIEGDARALGGHRPSQEWALPAGQYGWMG
jgi:hypothetical protein